VRSSPFSQHVFSSCLGSGGLADGGAQVVQTHVPTPVGVDQTPQRGEEEVVADALPQHVVDPVAFGVGQIMLPSAGTQLRQRAVLSLGDHLEVALGALLWAVSRSREVQELGRRVDPANVFDRHDRAVLGERLGCQEAARTIAADNAAPPGVRGFMGEQGQVAARNSERARVGEDEGLLEGRVPIETLARHLGDTRSEEHTSELQSRPHISYAVFCLKKKKDK